MGAGHPYCKYWSDIPVVELIFTKLANLKTKAFGDICLQADKCWLAPADFYSDPLELLHAYIKVIDRTSKIVYFTDF